MEFTSLSATEFQNFSDTHEGVNLYQTVDVAEFRRSQGSRVEFVGVKQSGSVIAATMMTSRQTQFGREYSAPGGFVIDYHDQALLAFFLQHLRSYLLSQRAFALYFAPRVCHRERDIDGEIVPGGSDNSDVITNLEEFGCLRHQPRAELGAGRTAAWNFQLNLTGHTEASLLASFRQTTRQSIRKSIQGGITVRDVGKGELPLFTSLIEASAKRNGILTKRITYYEKALAHFTHATRVRLLIAEKEGVALSAAMFLYHGRTVHYIFAGTPTEFLPLHPQFAIVWETMQAALKEGHELYDFGGISGDFGKTAAHKGLYTFKRGFRGHVVEYVGDFTLIVSAPRYKLYTRWKKLQGLTVDAARHRYAKLK